jgi:NTE family protein
VQIDVTKFSGNDYGKATALIQAGYDAAASKADDLKKYALNDADWQAYLADRASRMRPATGDLRFVKVEGGSIGAQAVVRHDMQPLIGKPITAPTVTAALRNVQSNLTDQAKFETFRQEDGAPESAPQDRTVALGPDDGIAVKLSSTKPGPPYLMMGVDISAASANVTRTTFDARLINPNLGGYGSELRTDLRMGFLTQASTEYYHLVSKGGLFIQPNLGLLRQPVYLWQDQKRISEHLEQQAGGGFDIGKTFNQNMQASAEYRAQTVRWHLVDGMDGTVPVSGMAQTAVLHFASDSNQSEAIVTGGLRTNIKMGALFNTVGSQNAPMLEGQIDKSFHVSQQGNIVFSLIANSYFRRNVTEPLRFTVGGPLLLSASSIDEYRGTDVGLLRAGYTHKIANLPSGYGHGLYAAFGYEGASIWSPEQHSILRQDGVITFLGVTPIGSITMGGSIGDDGHRKIFFTYGRLF